MAHQWIQETYLLGGPGCKAPRPPQAHGLCNRKGDVFDNFGSAFNNMKLLIWSYVEENETVFIMF